MILVIPWSVSSSRQRLRSHLGMVNGCRGVFMQNGSRGFVACAPPLAGCMSRPPSSWLDSRTKSTMSPARGPCSPNGAVAARNPKSVAVHGDRSRVRPTLSRRRCGAIHPAAFLTPVAHTVLRNEHRRPRGSDRDPRAYPSGDCRSRIGQYGRGAELRERFAAILNDVKMATRGEGRRAWPNDRSQGVTAESKTSLRQNPKPRVP